VAPRAAPVLSHHGASPPPPVVEGGPPPPFEPRHEDDRIYARGAGDDKGQLFMHLKAVEAWMAAAGRLPINLRFFFEGDTFDDDGTPSIGYGLRGIAYWEVRVRGPHQDVHSGQYGGGIDNPAN